MSPRKVQAVGATHGMIKKKVMATKKNIQKNDRKESGAGLAAGIESENTTQQNADATKTARK